jgi:hypothetical protein
MGMWTTLRRLRLAHIPIALTTTTLVPIHRQPEAFPIIVSVQLSPQYHIVA